MTTVAKLLARKQHLIEQLLDHPGPVNLKVARAMVLTIPQSLLVTTDEVIE